MFNKLLRIIILENLTLDISKMYFIQIWPQSL